MALSAIRTRILPGFANNGRRRVTVVSGNMAIQVVIPVPESESNEEMHIEALRCALMTFPDGWAGDYVGGTISGPYGVDYVWVRHTEPETPTSCLTPPRHRPTRQMGINLFDWKGNSA